METYHKSIPSGAQFYKEYLSWKSSSGFVYTSTSRNIYIVCEYVNTHTHTHTHIWSFPSGSDGKASICNAGDPDLIPGLYICILLHTQKLFTKSGNI